MEGREVKKVHLEVVESSRFFEALTKNRRYDECAALTQKICGICSVIHTVTSLKAMENLLGIKLSDEMKKLRELITISSQIYSHITHLYFMALPEYFGFGNAIEMVKKRPGDIKRAIKMNKLANEITTMIGGRRIHPVTMKLGGFWNIPTKDNFEKILNNLKNLRIGAEETVDLILSIDVPSFERKTGYFALKKDKKYQLIDGTITSLDGIEFEANDYEKFLKEHVKKYSTAKQSTIDGKDFIVGAIARLNINHRFLSDKAKDLLYPSGIRLPTYNPYLNNFAQAIEVVHFIEEGINIVEDLLDSYFRKGIQKTKLKSGEGIAACEAPRGILYHHYVIDNKGLIKKTNIITPTAQNLRAIENDIKTLLPKIADQSKHDIVHHVEKLIRAYDPCISCSTHFLQVKFE